MFLTSLSSISLNSSRKSIFTSFIDFGAEPTGNPLKKRIILSKNIIETVTLHYHFSKIDFRVNSSYQSIFLLPNCIFHRRININRVPAPFAGYNRPVKPRIQLKRLNYPVCAFQRNSMKVGRIR